MKNRIFLTAGNADQKRLCEKLVSEMKTEYNITVVADSVCDKRIGSGGAVFKILSEHYGKNDRFIIINSGGLSSRAINYSVKGKVFAEYKRNDKKVYLLEDIIENAEKVLSKIKSGVVVCCGDILLNVDVSDCNFSGSTAFCVRDSFDVGSRHGVMFTDEDGFLENYLHKKGVEELRTLASQYGQKSVLIDTGMVYLDSVICKKLINIAEQYNILNKGVEINLYPDIIYLLSKNIDSDKYISQAESPAHEEIRRAFLNELSEFGLSVFKAEKESFIHFGTLKESLENVISLSRCGEYVNINSYIDSCVTVGGHTLIENAVIEGDSTIGKGCIISDVTLENVKVVDEKAICGIKLKDGYYVTIVCDVKENPRKIENGRELWLTDRYYKGVSFTDSYRKFISSADENKYSMAYCIENADLDFTAARQDYIDSMGDYVKSDAYLKRRKELTEAYFEQNGFLSSVDCQEDRVSISLPVRVNLSGTWTDAMPYCIDNGGQVVNMAITVDGKLPIYICAEKTENGNIEFCTESCAMIFTPENWYIGDELSDFNLHRAVLKTMGINEKTKFNCGFRLKTSVKGIDKGSGLGTSSILLAGCFSALGTLFGFGYSEKKILNMVFVAEQIMNTGGGWQDQVGGFIPGMTVGTTNSGIYQEPNVARIEITENFRKYIGEKMLLVPTGQRHYGRFIVNDVVSRYLESNEESLSGHKEIRELNAEVIEAIKKCDIPAFSDGLNKHRELLKKISPLVTNDKIDEMVNYILNKADFVSFCGAGGGGYLLVGLSQSVDVKEFENFFKARYSNIKSKILTIGIYEQNRQDVVPE